jgi:hypothetical protein
MSNTFSKMPVEVWLDHRLTLKQIRVFGAILSFANADGSAHPKREAIALRCGMLPDNVSRATSQLVALGWLTKTGKGGYSMPASYQMTIPKTLSESDSKTLSETDSENCTNRTGKKKTNPVRIGQQTLSESDSKTLSETDSKTLSDSDRGKEQTIEQTNEQTITRPVAQTEKPELMLCATAAAEAPPELLTEFQAVCRETWGAYARAYSIRYGTDPIRNAKTNAQVVAYCKRIPRDEAPHVAESFVANNSAFYVSRGHQFGHLLTDAEKLRTEWATRRVMTSATARQIDSTQTNLNSAQQAKAILARRTA